MAKTLFRSPGVPPRGSVEEAKLAGSSLGPSGSIFSSDASVPPQPGAYGTASRGVPSSRSSRTVSPPLFRLGKPATVSTMAPGGTSGNASANASGSRTSTAYAFGPSGVTASATRTVSAASARRSAARSNVSSVRLKSSTYSLVDGCGAGGSYRISLMTTSPGSAVASPKKKGARSSSATLPASSRKSVATST